MEQVIKHFQELNKHPRPSNYETEVSDFLLSFAQKNGLLNAKDSANNVIIGKAGQHCKSSTPVILQAHMDMVAAADQNYNFKTNPVIPHIEGNLMTGRGSKRDEQNNTWIETDIHTTLGADDGIGIAIIMEILENREISHPPIVAVFTTGEEIGMLGAKQLTRDFVEKASHMDLSNAFLINVDEEQDGHFGYGCAGGAGLTYSKQWDKPESFIKDDFEGYLFTIYGLQGGHSGIDIGTGRANAHCLLGEILYQISKEIPFLLFEIKGGDAENAIPKSAKAMLGIPKTSLKAWEETVASLFHKQKELYKTVETTMNYSLTKEETILNGQPLSKEDQIQLLTMIHELPNDQQSYMKVEQKNPNAESTFYEVVETSCNLGIIEISWNAEKKKGLILLQSSVRSFYDDKRDNLIEKLQAIAEKYHFETKTHDKYSGWTQSEDSKLRTLFEETYFEQNKTSASGGYIHAGLECGVLENVFGHIDMIACGPTLKDVHTPRETLYLDTVPKTYNLIAGVLKKLAK